MVTVEMRVNIYAINYAPEPIGIPVYTAGMAIWMSEEKNWQITVQTGIPHYPWWSILPEYRGRITQVGHINEVLNGVTVKRALHYVPALPLTGLKRMRLDASWLFSVLKQTLLVNKKPHAVIIIAPPFLGGLLGVFLGWRWKIPVIYHVQDLQVDAAIDLKILPSWMGAALLLCERFILRHVDLVTTISEAMAQRIRGKEQTRLPITLFPNWVNDQVLIDRGRADQFRVKWSANSQIVIMYSGNLGAKQGLDVLLDAFALLSPSLPAMLVIAGAGPERLVLEQLCRDRNINRVHFMDLVAVEQLGDFLRAGDIHVIPQRRAAAGLVMPSKLLNIMAVGRPVIVTADKGTDLANIIERSGGGEVVEPESPVALAHALEQLVSNREQREHCGVAARKYILARFTIDRAVGTFARRVAALARRRK